MNTNLLLFVLLFFFLQEWNCFAPVLLPSSWCRAEAFISRLFTKVGNCCQIDISSSSFPAFSSPNSVSLMGDETHILYTLNLFHPPLRTTSPALLPLPFHSPFSLIAQNPLWSQLTYPRTSNTDFQPFFQHLPWLTHIHICVFSVFITLTVIYTCLTLLLQSSYPTLWVGWAHSSRDL